MSPTPAGPRAPRAFRPRPGPAARTGSPSQRRARRRPPAAAPRAFKLGADLSFLPREEEGGAVFRDGLGPADASAILRRHGFDWLRLRLRNDPSDRHGGLAEVLGLAWRARDRGMSLLLDVHYLDTWADPGRQWPPAAWAGLPLPALEDSLYRFTRDVVSALVAQDTPPAMVQLGNEITNGMLWDTARLGAGAPQPESWRALGRPLCAGARGVKDGAPGRDVVVVEASYPWTLAAHDSVHDLVGRPSQLHAGYPATPQGQAEFLRRLVGVVRAIPRGHGRGVFLWAPGWVSAPRFGSAGENLALFDGAGRLLCAADSLAAAVRAAPSP